jgi:glucose/arabinose dehydrogenase
VIVSGQGRLRTAVQGPDGSVYVATSNGGGADRILRVTPG